MTEKKRLFLIDANGYIHRAFHALPPLTNSRGEPVQALFGFARMLQKILRQDKPDYMAVCFDSAGPTFRHAAFEDYKGTRKKIEDALLFQLPLAKDMVEAWGLPCVALAGFEADDLIATMARKGVGHGLRVVIVTADKDAFQLVDADVSVWNDSKGILYSPAEVEEKYGLKPGQMVDFFALTGDASDNVPGVPGVGEKTAVQLLQRFGNLDKVLESTGELKPVLRMKLENNRDKALMSRDLVILDRNAPIALEPEACRIHEPDAEKLTGFFRRMEFNALVQEVAPPPAVRGARAVRIARTEEDFRALAAELAAAPEAAVDVETSALDALRSALVGISLSTRAGTAWYVPVGHDEQGAGAAEAMGLAVKHLSGPFADLRLAKTGHNLKYDLQVLRRHGLDLDGIRFDTLLASYCINPSRLNHGLKDLCLDLLGETMTPIDELIGKGAKQISMAAVAVDRAADYAGADAEVSLRLKGLMEPQLREKKLEKLFHDVEMPLLRILADMEKTGIRVDVGYLQGLQKTFEGEIGALEKTIYALAGEAFNLNSSKQLGALLFEKLKLPVVRRTKTGFSTDEEVLRKLSALHPVPAKMVEYRELAKLKSTYIDALLQMAREDTGRVHTSFNQAVAATGRLSSSDPNLQNIPIRTEYGRKIRRAFVADPGCVLLSADYSQIDLRVLAHVSRDPVLCEAFRKGGDVHEATAREIFGIAAGTPVTSEQRRVAKTVNFGIVYGQTPFGLSQQLGIPMATAKAYIDQYFERYEGVKKWIGSILEQARRDGYVTTLLNRIRYLPEIQSTNPSVRGFAERTAMNTPIQGTSADIIKVAMRELAGELAGGRFGARLLLQVHDDLLLEVPEAEAGRLAPVVRRVMEQAIALDVPLLADLKRGTNWSQMEKFSLPA